MGRGRHLDFNTDFHLVGRCQPRGKEDLGSRSPWVLGSHPAMPVPEERVHDYELPVENSSASEQGKHHTCYKHALKCLYEKRRRAGVCRLSIRCKKLGKKQKNLK